MAHQIHAADVMFVPDSVREVSEMEARIERAVNIILPAHPLTATQQKGSTNAHSCEYFYSKH